MTRLSTFLCKLSLCFSLPICAATFDAPLVKQSLLLDADSSNATVVVGERGHVVISNPDNTDYQQVTLPLATTLTAVETRGDKIWVVGHDATIMYSSDLGQSWSIQLHLPELQRPFLDVLFFDDQQGIALGAYGLFYRTVDGGQNWQSEQHISLLNPLDIEYLNDVKQEDENFYLEELSSILPHLNRVTVFGNNLYIAGETGLLASSSDLGKNWERFDVDYGGSFFDIVPVNNDVMLAVGLRGTVYYKHAESAWQRVKSCTTSTLNSIVTVDKETILIVGNNGAVINVDLPALVDNTQAECKVNGLTHSQLETKSAIATVIQSSPTMTAVTSDGLQPLVVK